MDKLGHLVVTKSLTGDMHRTYKVDLLLVSILLDLFVYSYLEGHKWEATFDKLINHMEVLEEMGRGGYFSYLKLGWVLHYVEVYFTYQHYTIFEGTIPEHYAYEKKITRWVRDGALVQISMPICKKLDSSSQFEHRIQELHVNYLSREMCSENDTAYMRQIVSEILRCYEEIFTNKCEFARFIGWVRCKAGEKTA